MNRKAKKRLSILKKAASSDESSPTFTKISRRISFSGKKSIKEFTSDDNKMTIWGNSYEESAEMIQSASHHTLAADSTISQSISQTMQCSKKYSQSVDKENEQINLRNRTVLKRKSNVLKAISVQPAGNPKDVTPNMETIEMDISINDSDNKSQKRISVGKLASPNLTPVPPQKISKLNQKVEEMCSINYNGGRRISDELFSEANFSIPSRILERDDVNLTFGFNLSEFDILKPLPHRPSENVTSFATKIDRLNFSNEDEPHNEDNSVMLKIRNPQIEQMLITGTIVTATKQNLDISVEINDGSKVFDNLRQSIPTKLKETEVAEPPPTPESPKANPVLEMFKIRNELKKQMGKQFEEKLEKEYILPFISAKFETPSMPNFNPTNRDANLSELGSNQYTIVFSNKEMGLTKMKKNKKRETILFAKDNADLDMSLSDEDIDSGPKSKRATIHFQNDNLESSIICERESTEMSKNVQDTQSYIYPVTEFSMQNDLNIHGSSRFVDEIKKVKDTSRGTIYFLKEAELETSLDENNDFTVSEKNARQTKRATIHYPNQDLEMTTIETAQNIKAENTNLNITEAETAIEQFEIRDKRDTIHLPKVSAKRGTIHFVNCDLETSIVDESENLIHTEEASKFSEKHEAKIQRGTINISNQELEMSTVHSCPNIKEEESNWNLTVDGKSAEKYNGQTKRGTIHFRNQELETSVFVLPVNQEVKECEERTKRGTIHFPNQQLEMTSVEPSPKLNRKQTKRDTVNFLNQDLEFSLIEICPTENGKNQQNQIIRGTIHFPNHDLETSLANDSVKENMKSTDDPKYHEEKATEAKRGTFHFPNQSLEMSLVESNPNLKEEDINESLQVKAKLDVIQNQELQESMIELCSIENGREQNKQTEQDSIHFSIDKKLSLTDAVQQIKRGTVCFTNQELETSMINLVTQARTLKVAPKMSARQETQIKRGTIHFPNQQLDMSIVEPRPNEKDEKQCGKSTNRGTIHFPKQELDLSTVESVSNVKSLNKNLNSKEAANAGRMHEKSTKRETIHFANQELDTSLIVECVTTNQDEIIPHSNRSTIHHSNRQLEISMDDLGLNESKQGTVQIDNKWEKQTKRETIHFLNQELDTSIFEHRNQISYLENAKHETETKRGTINFPNQQLDMSTVELHQYEKGGKKFEKLTNRGTIHFPKQELDLSTAESILNIKGQNKNLNTRNPSKMQENSIKRETVHFENHELDTSLIIESVAVPELHPERKTHSNRGTIHYPNQHLEVSMDDSGPNESKRGTVQIDNKWEKQTKRETIHFLNQELDTSIFEHRNQITYLENAKHETETKRGTIHFPNQQLEASTVESHRNAKENKNLKSIEGHKTSENCERQKQRATMYFSNEELEISKMKEEHEANVKVELTNKESVSNVKGQNRNLNLTRATNTTKRDTMHFANQEIDSSLVAECVDKQCEGTCSEKHKPQSNRGTIHFPNEQLEISKFEPSSNMKVANRNMNLIVAAKRGTLHFPNQELEMSTIVSYSNQKSEDRNPDVAAELSDKLKGSTKRGTVYFQSQDLENSMVVEAKALTAVNSDTHTSRKTIYFHTQDVLDRRLPDLHLQNTSENEQIKTKIANRATTYFVNESLDASMEEVKQIKPKNSSHRTIHCNNENDFDISIQERTKYLEHATDFDMSATENNFDSSMAKKIYPRTPLPCNIFEISDARELHTIQPQPLIPGATYYEDKTLDLSEFEIKSRHTLYLEDKEEEEDDDLDNINIEPKIESIKQPSRSTIYFPNQRLDTSKTGDAEQMDTSIKESTRDKHLLRGTIHYVSDDLETTQLSKNEPNTNNMGTIPKSVIPVNTLKEDTHEYNRYTIHYQNQELETTLPMDNENANVKHLKDKESEIEKNRATIHFSGTGLNDLDMSAQPILTIDHSEAKRLRPHSERFQSRIKELEEKIWGQRRSVNVSINLESEEMDLSSYEKPDEQLDNDLSGLKLSGLCSTDFENNTQALCNLDPKRIYCVSKYDGMNVTTPVTDQPNISPGKLTDETMLHDLVPRNGNFTTFQELLEITANVPEQNKTRKEICEDYINLTLSRFSHSFANSSIIDETTLQLVNSLDELEEVEAAEKKSNISDHGIMYVKVEDANLIYQNVDEMLTRKKTGHVPVLDLTKCQELLNQPSFSEIANEYKLKNLIDSKRVSDFHKPMMGPEKPSLRFLMNNYREQMMKEFSEKNRKEIGIAPFLPLTPKITTLLQNKLAERTNYWTCHDDLYNHGIIVFTHHRVPCIKIKMLFDFYEETEFGELDFISVIPMMSKTKIIASTFELIQHLQFFKNVPCDMKNMCRRSNEILDFLDNLDTKIITKNYENVKKLKNIMVSTNSKIWHENDTGQCGITKSIIHKRNIYDIIVKISDLQITDISDVTVKPKVQPTNKVKDLTRGLDFLQKLLEKPRDYFNFDK